MDGEDHRKRCATMLLVFCTVVAAWEQTMYSIAAHFILNLEEKKRKKKRKRVQDRLNFVQALAQSRDPNQGHTPYTTTIHGQEDDVSLGQNRAESSSRKRGSNNKEKIGEELIEAIRASCEALQRAIVDAANCLSYPKDLRFSEEVAVELRKITELSERESEACHEWLSLNEEMGSIFLARKNKKDWILRRLPGIMQSTLVP